MKKVTAKVSADWNNRSIDFTENLLSNSSFPNKDVKRRRENTKESSKNCRQSLNEPVSKQTGTTLDPQTATIFLLPNKRQTVWLRIHRRDGFREQSNEAFWIIRCLLNALCHSKQQLNRGRMKARPLTVRLRTGVVPFRVFEYPPTSSGPTPPPAFFCAANHCFRLCLAQTEKYQRPILLFLFHSWARRSLRQVIALCKPNREFLVNTRHNAEVSLSFFLSFSFSLFLSFSHSFSLSLSFSQWRAPGSRAQLKFWYVSILLCFLPFLCFFHFAFVPRCFSTMFHGGSSIIFLWFRKGFQLKRRNTVGVNGCVGLSTRLNFSDELAVLKGYFFRCL